MYFSINKKNEKRNAEKLQDIGFSCKMAIILKSLIYSSFQIEMIFHGKI